MSKFGDVLRAIGEFLNGDTETQNQPVLDSTKSKERSVSVMNELMTFVRDELQKNFPPPIPQPTLDENGNEIAMDIAETPAQMLDLYASENEIFAVVTLDDGKLYKMPLHIDKDNNITADPLVPVSMEFTEMSRGISITREVGGKVRWFAMPACTAVLNRSGEIDSTALFDSFVEYAQAQGNYPELDFYHMGEQVVLGRADFVARDGINYIASGYFYDTPIARAAVIALERDPGYWGLSIAYVPTSRPYNIRSTEGIEIPVYSSGINRYISLLPEKMAASILTSIAQTEEVNRMRKDVEDALRKLVGDNEDLFKEFSERLDSINRQSSEMISREGTTPVTTTEVTHVEKTSTPIQPSVSEVRANELDPETIAGIIQQILISPEFEAKVTEIIAKVAGEKTPEEPKAPEEPKVPEQVQQSIEALEAGVRSVTERFEAFIKGEEEKERTVENDQPAKKTLYRPRATITPQNLTTRNKATRPVDLAAVAETTLKNMES